MALIKLFQRKATQEEKLDLTRVDRERMDKAIAAQRFQIPSGLTAEQKRQFILSAK